MSAPDSMTQPWPPREGKKFFLLWLAGLVAMRVVSFALMAAANAGATIGAGGRMIFLVPAIALHGWQAWLLFSRRPARTAIWTALPLLSLAAGDDRWRVELLGIIVPLIETALLAGVRLRPWAWLLAGMGTVIVSTTGGALITNLAYARLTPMLPQGTVSIVVTSAWSGLWLICEAAAAYVLAFWMPVVAGERGEGGGSRS